MAQILWIPGPLPTLNEMLQAAGGSGGRRAAWAGMKRAWTDTVCLLARTSKLRPVARAKLRFVWHERNRRRDPDNVAAAKKFALDGLVVAGILPDDGWDEVVSFSDEWIIANRAGVVIVIEGEVIDSPIVRRAFAGKAGKA